MRVYATRFGVSQTPALLLPLIEDTIDEFQAKLTAALDEADRKNGDLADVAAAYVRTMLGEFRQHGRVLQQVVRSASGEVAATAAERINAFNEAAHGQFRESMGAKKRDSASISARRDRDRTLHCVGCCSRGGE